MKGFDKPYTFDRVIRLLISLVILVLLFFLVKKLSSVLLPFFIAWLIAYLLQPFVGFFQNKLKIRNRAISVIVALLTIIAVIAGLAYLFIPMIINEFGKLSAIVSNYTHSMDAYSFLPVSWQQELRNYLMKIDLKQLMSNEHLIEIVRNAVPKLWVILNSSLSFIWGFAVIFIIMIYLFFILKDYERISNGLLQIIPVKYRKLTGGIIRDLELGMNAYFRGQFLIALIVGILFTAGFLIIGFPLAIVFGLFIGMINLVPYLKTIAIVPALLLAFLKSVENNQSFFSVVLGVVIVFVIVQVIEDFVLIPRIMGNVTGLNPAVILLSLSVWGALMGVIGLIIALPLTTLAISYYKRFVLNEPEGVFVENLGSDDDLQKKHQ